MLRLIQASVQGFPRLSREARNVFESTGNVFSKKASSVLHIRQQQRTGVRIEYSKASLETQEDHRQIGYGLGEGMCMVNSQKRAG